MLTMRDVLSPAAFVWARIIGYGVFGVAFVVVVAAGYRAYCDSQTAYNRYWRYR